MTSETQKSSSRLSNAEIRAWIDQVLFVERYVTDDKELLTLDKAVGIAIGRFVNCKTGSTYVDPLTIAKALHVELSAVRAAIDRLVKAGHLKTRKVKGLMTPLLIPVLKSHEGVHSTRGDKAFYNAHARLRWRVLFDRRMTIAQRVANIATLSQVDAETGTTCASQAWLSKKAAISRPTMRGATAKLEAFGYLVSLDTPNGEKQAIRFRDLQPGKTPGKVPGKLMREKPRQMGVSEHNIVNLGNIVAVVEGREDSELSIDEGERPAVTLADPLVIDRWRQLWPSLMANIPIDMIGNDLADYVDAGLVIPGAGQLDYEITPLGQRIGPPESTLKQRAAA